MKKIFNILAAGLMSVFALTSCAEKEIVTYVPENVVAPVLDELSAPEGGFVLVDGENFATLTFSPIDFGIATAARYTAYVDINEDFSTKQSLGNVTTDTLGITISASTLNNALMAMLCDPEVPVTVYFMLQTEMMGESSPVDAVGIMSSNVISTTVVPYNAERTYDMVYVVGDPLSWDFSVYARLFNYAEDEENYVGVLDLGTDNTKRKFKITGELNWDNGNWGTGSMTSSDPEASSITLWDNGLSGNITNYSSFRYYNFHFVKSSLTLNMIQGFNSVKVAGDFNGWTTGDANTDEMIQIRSNGKFYIDLDITAAGGFKFILDVDAEQPIWIGTGEGENGVGIGTGDNIQITEPGQYRFYLDLNDWENPTYSLSTADYGQPVE